MERTLENTITFNRTLLTILRGLHFLESCQNRRRRSQWVRQIFMERDEQGDFQNLFEKLKNDPEKFLQYTRMNYETFKKLSKIVKPYIQKKNWRALCAEERLLITIRFLATGDSYGSISFAFRIGKPTVCLIIRETCPALWNALKAEYLPSCTAENFKDISAAFWLLHGMPNCFGAIDGKHVIIEAIKNSGSLYFNYKRTFSIVLLAVCDAKLRFTMVDIGAYGSESDGGIFARSKFGKDLLSGKMPLPEPSPLPGETEPTGHFLVGDEAFPLKETIMRPYSGRDLPKEHRTFNKRLSKARRTIENTFGVMAARWRVYRRPICAEENTIVGIIKSTVVLHNFLRTLELEKQLADQRYSTPLILGNDEHGATVAGTENEGLQNLRRTGNYAGARAINMRQNLTKFLNSPHGALPGN